MRQETIVKAYRMLARIYPWSVPFYLLGQEGRTRREAVAALNLHTGDTVLDLACGIGSNFPYLQQAIGPSGHIIGFDYTPAMLAKARERVARAGWDNVTLIRGDAAQLSLDGPVDAALCTFALSVIPDWRAAIARAVDALCPGGAFTAADAKLNTHPLGRLLNPIARLMGWGAAADLSRRPWEEMQRHLTGVEFHEFFLGGFFYVVQGQKA
jgi:ubiquinone/menaquinone biosynthesis C-methylase UbiE